MHKQSFHIQTAKQRQQLYFTSTTLGEGHQ